MKVESMKIVELDLEPVEDIVEGIKVGNYYVAGDHHTWDQGLTPGRAYKIVQVGDDLGCNSGLTGLLEGSHEFEIMNDQGKYAYMSRSALKCYRIDTKGQLMKEIEHNEK